jgi:hypothetical protein
MAVTAFQEQFRQEYIAGFEEKQSILRSTTVTEAVVKGNTATFLVADSGGSTAVTRGVNGLIPARSDDNEQLSATLAEWHDLVQKTGFNVFASQGDQRRIMQDTSMGVVNRKIDTDIIAALDTATIDTGAAATFSVNLVAKALGYLGNNSVPITETENMFGVITPGAWAHAMQLKEFASGEYVDVKLFSGAIKRYFRWFGVNWMLHPLLTGVGTSSEKCYVYHRNAIGHAVDTSGLKTAVGYDDEQDYSFCRTSIYMGSKKLQNTGIVQMLHDGSAFGLS